MKTYLTLHQAASEIRRDLAKGSPVVSTRVQQKTGLNLKGRELIGYEYGIYNMEDLTAVQLLQVAATEGFDFLVTKPAEMALWLNLERDNRIDPMGMYLPRGVQPETLHPALEKTLEGNYPSYTYPDRMVGATEIMTDALSKNPDSRRVFWPIFTPSDAIRSADPTRIPCSLGYSLMIRQVNDEQTLILTYLERSCDFDHFWLSDLWLAREFQKNVATRLDIKPGLLIHFILSLHSFDVENQEIY